MDGQNYLFLNNAAQNSKDWKFEDITRSANVGQPRYGFPTWFWDYDNDGDQDIYTIMGGAYSGDNFFNALFENPNDKNSWITLKLEGTYTNKAAIGTRIKVSTTNKKGESNVFYSHVSSGGSLGASSLQQEMGLADALQINEIEITWANKNRTIEKFTDVTPNKR